MKKILSACSLALVLTALSIPSARAASDTASSVRGAQADSGEDWKGPSDGSEVHLGGLTGLGIMDYHTGFALLGTASKKIVHKGFVSELNDSVSIETELGPVFIADTTVFSYSLHLRWDFQLNNQWTFYGLGGLAGYAGGSHFGNDFTMFPRFGVGVFYRANDLLLLRGEISQDLVAVGLTIPFYY